MSETIEGGAAHDRSTYPARQRREVVGRGVEDEVVSDAAAAPRQNQKLAVADLVVAVADTGVSALQVRVQTFRESAADRDAQQKSDPNGQRHVSRRLYALLRCSVLPL